MIVSLTLDELKNLLPCGTERIADLGLQGDITVTSARALDVPLYDVLLVVARLAKKDADVLRAVRMWGADCAARALHLFERKCPGDNRARNAIAAARLYAGHVPYPQNLRDAHRSAYQMSVWQTGKGNAAKDAATAAAQCAAIPTQSQGPADPSFSAAAHAAWAAGWAELAKRPKPRQRDEVLDLVKKGERLEQYRLLAAWISNSQPEPVSLDYKKEG